MNSDPIKTTFVTFYSFKGGVGRSMALINTASILAGTRGFRVLVLDLDLEAPGLSYLNSKTPDVEPADTQRNLPLQPGFVDLLTDAKERGEDADLFRLTDVALRDKYTRKINLPADLCKFSDGSLHIMPAGCFDDQYSRRLDALNLNSLYREGLGEPLIRAFKKKLSASGLYHYVFVDSRTGISEGAGICTRDLADHVMVLSGLNRQNVEGTSEFLREFRKATNAEKKFQIILSPIPNGEDALVDERCEVARKRFKEAWGGDVELTLEIPYHPQLALTEEPHIFRRSRGYLFEAYRRIEESLLKELGHVAQNFRSQILEALKRKQYSEALRDLSVMIRLDDGYRMLTRLVDGLLNESAISKRAEWNTSPESVSLKDVLADDDGREVVNFIIQEIPINEWGWSTHQLILRLNRKFPELAKNLDQRILEQDNSEFLGRYAVTLDKLKQSDRAETAYKRAVETDPNNASTLVNYADFLEKQGRTGDAEPFFQRALEADPNNAAILGNYAVLLLKQGQTGDAEPLLKRTLEADPKHANSLGNYAVLLEKQGRAKEAEAFYLRALEADPKDANILGNYALFLEKQGRAKEAEAFYLRALETDPKHANVLGNYAVFLEKRGRIADAEAFYLRALEADPKHANHLGNYAIFLEKQGRIADAETFYQRALQANPKHANHLGNYALLLEKQGRIADAETFYQRALQANPKDANILGNYAPFLEQQGRSADAETFYQRALQADPKHVNHLGNYAVFLEKQGRSADAETFYQCALQADPKHANILGNYANLLVKQGRSADAETFFQRALKADPKDANILGNYGQFLIGEARTHEGEAFLLKSSHHFDEVGYDNIAEICFALWLCLRMQGNAADQWEGCFKFALEKGFERYPWSFERMLKQAEKLLSPEELEYANALAAAFLDASKVATLENFPRWLSVKPIDPKHLSSGASPSQPSPSAS